MGTNQKLEILRAVESCGLPVREALVRMDVPRTTKGREGAGFVHTPCIRATFVC